MQPTPNQERQTYASINRICDSIDKLVVLLDPVLCVMPLKQESGSIQTMKTPLQSKLDEIEERMKILLNSINL